MATTSSCSSFFNLRSNSNSAARPRTSTSRGSSSHGGCGGKLDGVGMWLMNGFASAFFASMEKLSCIRVNTHDDERDDAYDVVPLIPCDGNFVVKNQAGSGGGASKRKIRNKGFQKDSGSFLED